jgi:MFS family permease
MAMTRIPPGAYLGELRAHSRTLAAASLGLASGYQLTGYLSNLFGPYLLHTFGWSKAQLSLGGAAALSTVILGPVAGRITDAIGARPMVIAGVIATPLIYTGYASMNGDIRLFLLLAVLQTIMMGLTTSSLTYCRLVAQEFTRARGVALAIAACSPAVASMLAAHPLAAFMVVHGWRAGYLALAVATAITGAVTLLLMPRGSAIVTTRAERRYSGAALFRQLPRNTAFLVITIGLLLCNLPIMMQASQLGVLLQDHLVSPAGISWMVALYAVAVLSGRLLCGLCLDRFPTHLVVALAMALPGVGLLSLASGVTATGVLAASVALLGLSTGAEVDIVSYLVMRYFPVTIFSTVIGLVASAMALSAAVGALILSLTLRVSGGYTLFLLLTGCASLIGGTSFLLLPRGDAQLDVTEPGRPSLPLAASRHS